jgi:hypothetical protein
MVMEDIRTSIKLKQKTLETTISPKEITLERIVTHL